MKRFRSHPKSSLRKVSSQMKLETLFKKKPLNRHSPYRLISTPLGNCPQFQLIKPTSTTKIRQELQGQSLQCQLFISDMHKSNDDKFLYLVGNVLQSWVAL